MHLRTSVCRPHLPALAAIILLGSCAPFSKDPGGGSQTASESGDGADTATTGGGGAGGTTSGDGAGDTTSANGTADTTGNSATGSETSGADPCGEDDPPPVVYFPFDDCSDVTPEAMGTGLDATLVEASCTAEDDLSNALGTSWSSGTALLCSGEQSACAEAPDDPLFEPAYFTIAAWIFSPDWTSCGWYDDDLACTIVSKATRDVHMRGYWFQVHNEQLALIVGRGEVDGHSTSYGSLFDANVWYHVVATFDGTTISLYVDGVLGGWREIPPGITYGDEAFLIGAMTDQQHNHHGFIDEVKLWDYAKTADEVADLYSSYIDC
jgi:hypothetical protein